MLMEAFERDSNAILRWCLAVPPESHAISINQKNKVMPLKRLNAIDGFGTLGLQGVRHQILPCTLITFEPFLGSMSVTDTGT